MVKITLELDEEEFFLAEYLAETAGVSVEQAAKDALLEMVRRLYESHAGTDIRQRAGEDIVDDDPFADEDR